MILVVTAPSSPGSADNSRPDPLLPPAPVAPRRPTVLETHGDKRVDDWYWLGDRQDPAVRTLLEEENAFTERATESLADLRHRLFGEIRSRIVETDLSVPVRKGPWWYYARTEEGLNYAAWCRLPVDGPGRDPAVPPGTADAGTDPPRDEPEAGRAAPARWSDEQVMLDENVIAEGESYLSVVNVSVSPGQNLLTYAVDITGDERFTLKVRDLDTGVDLPDTIENTSYGVAWANDDATIFYARPDSANRPYQLWRHRLGSLPGEDVLVFEEPDERFHLGVGRTKDGAFVVLELQSQVTSEVHIVSADHPEVPLAVVAPRRQGVEYAVEHHTGTLLVLTNDEAENFRLMAVSPDNPGRPHWREVIAHRLDARLDGVEPFARHLVCYERVGGEPRIRVIALPDGPPAWDTSISGGWLVPSPETPSASWGGGNPEFDATTLRYEYSSLVTPRSVYDLNLDDRQSVLRKRQPVLGGYNPDDYLTGREWAVAPDGTNVPLSLVWHRDTPRDATAPCLLYGYGAYEHSIDAVFSSIRLSLLDRGVVFAIAHVRGGGELGRRWYEEGKGLAKTNTFTDFVACAQHLVESGWTSPPRLVARGGSAGGLLMGAVANMAPEFFRAVVAEVPFVDCLTTILDDTLPLSVIEREEWGDPVADVEIYDVMKHYSPYDNVRPGRYPDVLATAGFEDPRVGYWEPTKWVQKLRAADPSNRVLLKVELDSGHGGPSGRYDAWRDEAWVLAFILDAIGLAD